MHLLEDTGISGPTERIDVLQNLKEKKLIKVFCSYMSSN